MATLPLKSSHNKQCAVIRFLWAKGLDTDEIHSEMRPVYGDKCFMRPAIHTWCTKFARSRESIVDKEQYGRRIVATTDATIAAVDAFIDRWDKCLNELGQYVEE